MTFYEAAVEVLREAGRPLHFKKITEISIRRELLSHVGKTPEITMGARLEIEAAKPASETLLVRVRPGVYSLREGADVAEASQTIKPRGYVEVPDEEAEETDDAASETPEDDTGDAEAAASEGAEAAAASGSAESASSRRRRRRGRRGGRGRARETGETDGADGADGDGDEDGEADASDALQTADSVESDPGEANQQVGSWDPIELTDDAPSPTPPQRQPKAAPAAEKPAASAKPAPTAPQRKQQTPPPAPAQPRAERNHRRGATATEPLALNEAGDIARALVSILQASTEPAQHARALAAELASRRVAGLGKVGPAVLREHIEFANLRRTRLGRPPLFEEVRPNQWALAAASGSGLAASYSALDRWQDSHRDALRSTLLERLRALSGEALCSIVGLTLDRLGYRDIRTHEPIGDELLTLSAATPRALTGTRIAVRIARPGQAIGRERVAALRGALHSYDSSEGALISVAGFEEGAQSEGLVPNLAPIALIDADKLVEHMLAASVGVTTFHVDVRCIDESLFRDLPNGQ